RPGPERDHQEPGPERQAPRQSRQPVERAAGRLEQHGDDQRQRKRETEEGKRNESARERRSGGAARRRGAEQREQQRRRAGWDVETEQDAERGRALQIAQTSELRTKRNHER